VSSLLVRRKLLTRQSRYRRALRLAGPARRSSRRRAPSGSRSTARPGTWARRWWRRSTGRSCGGRRPGRSPSTWRRSRSARSRPPGSAQAAGAPGWSQCR